jgi:hypothetical protein
MNDYGIRALQIQIRASSIFQLVVSSERRSKTTAFDIGLSSMKRFYGKS